jgi:heparan-sulfate lyase
LIGMTFLPIVLASATVRAQELESLRPETVLTVLDLSGQRLEAARRAADQGDRTAALAALLEYYRQKYPMPDNEPARGRRSLDTADGIVRHVFQWGPYESADYGPEINWEWDPRGDIEWVAAMYRFFWAGPLAQAYHRTRDEQYARAFVELTSDWIAKHPLQNRSRAHPVYAYWRGFAWLDIQTGRRATSLCSVFPILVHSRSFTPDFLGVFLASLYDHQVKTERLPMNQVHNKAVFEQRGFINVASMFPEFRESRKWAELAMQRTRQTFLEQVTEDGVQREWSYGYHESVLRDAEEIMEQAAAAGVAIPEDYRQRVGKMYEYIFWMATPDLGAPMFGDASRPLAGSGDRSQGQLYSVLMRGTQRLGDPKHAALARLDRQALPAGKSRAFAQAGMYALRNDWGPDQIYLGLHCSPPAISSHDQPDNGTFELSAYGRWLMPDTGFYTYGHDREARAWHRQTRVHQTLTLDGKDSTVAGRHLLWKSEPTFDALTVENGSYDNLVHRRSVWFVDRKFFALLDEAVGKADGELDLHFQFAPGEVRLNQSEKWARTEFDDANVLVWTDPAAPVSLSLDEGWFAWRYGSRVERKAIRYRLERRAPAAMLTLLVPFRGTETPRVSGALPADFVVGTDRVSVRVGGFGKSWEVGRDLSTGEAWCRE